MNMRDKTFYLSTKEDIIEIYFHKYAGIIKVSVGVGSDVGNKFKPQDDQVFENYTLSLDDFKLANGIDIDADIDVGDINSSSLWVAIDQIRVAEVDRRTNTANQLSGNKAL